MSVTAPDGFRASGVTAGLKASGKPDLALVVNDGPTFAAAGVFTSNRFLAAPVLWSQQVLTTGTVKAVVLNSGGANACTGSAGFQDTHVTAEHVAAGLGIGAVDVSVCSTGLIGERLAMELLTAGVDAAISALAVTGGPLAAEAIMTTDTVAKQVVRTHRDGWSVGGMAKGAGMLAPGLATMLVVLTTDAVVEADQLDRALRAATQRSFDRIDSDGCMSTNDTVLLLASGASRVVPEPVEFAALVADACLDLAMQLITDAEGAEHDITVEVTRAHSEGDALEVARCVARSNLLKCAIFGRDPNWGRVLAAAGTAQAPFEPGDVDVTINGITVCRGGGVGQPRDLVDLNKRDVHIIVDLGAGEFAATVWTNDLTHAYVHENSAYST